MNSTAGWVSTCVTRNGKYSFPPFLSKKVPGICDWRLRQRLKTSMYKVFNFSTRYSITLIYIKVWFYHTWCMAWKCGWCWTSFPLLTVPSSFAEVDEDIRVWRAKRRSSWPLLGRVKASWIWGQLCKDLFHITFIDRRSMFNNAFYWQRLRQFFSCNELVE